MNGLNRHISFRFIFINSWSKNPLVHHDVKIDPTSLSEEQQIELAMKQSIIDNNVDNNNNTSYKSGNTIDDAIELIVIVIVLYQMMSSQLHHWTLHKNQKYQKIHLKL